MSTVTKFGVIVSEKRAEVHEHEIPSIKSDEVLLENRSCNICTTDYQQWMGLRPHQPVPMAFGHENSGVVVDVGSEVRNLKVGDHAAINIYFPCMECENCRAGTNSLFCRDSILKLRKNQADEHGYYGFYGCSKYQIAKSKHAYKIANDVPFEYGGFAEPLSTVVHGMGKLRVKTGEKLLVIGAGTMGNLNAQVARYFGADVTVADISEKKLQNARKAGFANILNAADDDYIDNAGAITGGSGFNAIIVAVGATRAYDQAVNLVADDGRLLIFAAGYPSPEWTLDPNTVHYKLWEIIGTFGCSAADYQRAVNMLSEKAVDVSLLVENRVPLEEIQKAFEKASTPDTFRTAVMM